MCIDAHVVAYNMYAGIYAHMNRGCVCTHSIVRGVNI